MMPPLNSLSAFLSFLLLFSSITTVLAIWHDEFQQSVVKPVISDIPAIGLGLWNSKNKDAKTAVEYAFEAGYSHLDSAAAYNNEECVGSAIALSPLPRSSYWVTSKLWNDHHQPGLVRPALEKTLSDLKLPYLDLYLMHWPVAFEPSSSTLDNSTTILETWLAMEDLVRANLTRYIGISNFSPKDVKSLLANCSIRPYAHEFETHPYLQQSEFVAHHQKLGIKVIAYSPLANLNPTYRTKLPPIIEDPFWVKLAAMKNATAAQAILAWGMARGTVVIPKSVHEARIVENLGSLKIDFSPEEMAEIQKHDKKVRFNNPSKSWKVKLFKGLDDGA